MANNLQMSLKYKYKVTKHQTNLNNQINFNLILGSEQNYMSVKYHNVLSLIVLNLNKLLLHQTSRPKSLTKGNNDYTLFQIFYKKQMHKKYLNTVDISKEFNVGFEIFSKISFHF